MARASQCRGQCLAARLHAGLAACCCWQRRAEACARKYGDDINARLMEAEVLAKLLPAGWKYEVERNVRKSEGLFLLFYLLACGM